MDMTLEDMSQEKSLIHQEYAYFSVLLTECVKQHSFQKALHHKDSEKHGLWCMYILNVSRTL